MRITLLCVLAAMLLATAACTTVQPGHVGIVINQWGKDRGVADIPTTTGFVTYNPFSTTVFSYPTNVQTVKWTASLTEGKPVDESITFTNKDNMTISADISASFSLIASKVPAFYVKFRSDDLDQFTHGYFRNVTRDAFNETGGKYSIDQIMGDNAAFLAEVRTHVQTEVAPIGVMLEQFGIIGAPRPPAAVTQAINAKLQATQIAIQKENEVRQAQADAAKSVASAKGAADSAIETARGEAEANKIKQQSITPTVLEWRRLDIQEQQIRKWNGTVPSTVLGSGNGFTYTRPLP